MKIILIVFALATVQFCAHAGIETDIPPKNRIVLKSGHWMPTPEQTQKALLSVHAFLSRPATTSNRKNAEIEKILANTKKYRVQFIGVLRNGKKVIRCNFFPAPTDGGEDGFQYWKQEEVMVNDGGYWFWRIDYDPDTDKCSDFESNGYA